MTEYRPGVGGALMLMTTRALEERLVVVVHVRVNARVAPCDDDGGSRGGGEREGRRMVEVRGCCYDVERVRDGRKEVVYPGSVGRVSR